MKKIYTLFIALAFTLNIAFAQTAPDFTVTDTHGTEHNLYADYLDQGKVVVLDLFFVDCPPCNELSPLLEPLYQQWGAGNGDVEFISLTSRTDDTDAKVIGFEELHGTTWPAASGDGGGPAAQAPYATGDFGDFFGYPTLIVISPDRSVIFDVWSNNSMEETVTLLDEAIASTGATGATSTDNVVAGIADMKLVPNIVQDASMLEFNLSESADIEVTLFNIIGKKVEVLYNGNRPTGFHQLPIYIGGLANGPYFVQLKTASGKMKTLKLIKA